MRASEIAKFLDSEFIGPGDPDISSIGSINSASSRDIVFLHNPSYRKWLTETKAGCVVLKKENIPIERNYAVIVSTDPHRSMAECVDILYPERLPKPQINSEARIHASARVAEGVYIGPFTAIGADSVIEEGCVIGDGVSIGQDVIIGPKSMIYAGVKIYSKTEIGEKCIIHAGTVLGSDGFGFAPTPEGILKVRQVGKLIIEDSVEIGANCTVDRGSFGETRIGKGSKIDNLVQIAHNCIIGKYCLIAAQSGFAGSTSLGDRVMVAGQVGFAGHQKIGDDSLFYAKSGITGDVPAGSRYFGIPAKNSIEAHRESVYVSQLNGLFKRVKELEKKLKEI
ncbi:UDP-3-O-(3-hydroxymyristoyl)glucosamine N-acyltransferase [bacterium]|nr:UDP-3-O-(3-hydroxymyristoyl)glucosamine N-acyltransferase [bacterium]